MPEGSRTHMGGTMRLGSRQTNLQTEDCDAFRLYGGQMEIHERHRHRYEVNPDMDAELEAAGMRFVGKDTEGERMEIIELADHILEPIRGRDGWNHLSVRSAVSIYLDRLLAST